MRRRRSRLDPAFLARPIAHRGLHDVSAGAPENSLAAFRLATEAGCAIECDLQSAADGRPVVFHDTALDRLTSETGEVYARERPELEAIALQGGSERIPGLPAALDAVGGRTPIFLEIKLDNPRLWSTPQGAYPVTSFCAYVLEEIDRGRDQVALMSFSSKVWLEYFWDRGADAPALGAVVDTENALRAALEAEAAGRIDFISCAQSLLPDPELQRRRASGLPVICWTITSEAQADEALRYSDQITFEGFRPPAA